MESQFYTTPTADLAMLNLADGVASTQLSGPFHQANMHLYTNNLTVNKLTPLADLTEANFPGYAASDSITFNAPILEADGSYSKFSQTVQFAVGATTTTVNQTIYGVYLTGSGSASATLLGVGSFLEPITLTQVGQGVNVNVVINQGASVPNMEVNAMQ